MLLVRIPAARRRSSSVLSSAPTNVTRIAATMPSLLLPWFLLRRLIAFARRFVARGQEFLRNGRQWRHFVGIERLDEMRRHENEQLGALAIGRPALEQIADDRNRAQDRDALVRVAGGVVHQAGNRKRLT